MNQTPDQGTPVDLDPLGVVPAVDLPLVSPARAVSSRRVAQTAGQSTEHVITHLGPPDWLNWRHGVDVYSLVRAVPYMLAFMPTPRAHIPDAMVHERRAWWALAVGHAYRYPRSKDLGGAHLWVARGAHVTEGTVMDFTLRRTPLGDGAPAKVTVGEVIVRYGDVVVFVSAEDRWRLDVRRHPDREKTLMGECKTRFQGAGLVPRLQGAATTGAGFVLVDDLYRVGWDDHTISTLLGVSQTPNRGAEPGWDVRRVWLALLGDSEFQPREWAGLAPVRTALSREGRGGLCMRVAAPVKGSRRMDFVRLLPAHGEAPLSAVEVLDPGVPEGESGGVGQRRGVARVLAEFGGAQAFMGLT